MVYKENFVVALKVSGKVLRESGGEVELPFGSEYSILLKNLNSVKAQAQISIDGEVAGPWYVLDPNGSMEIERFNRTGNQHRGNRFKFIERTATVEEHRGIKAEDGLIRVEFKKEKVQPVVHHQYTYHHHYHDYGCFPRPYDHYYWNGAPLLKDASPTISCRSLSGGLSGRSGQMTAMNMSFAGSTSGSSNSPTFRPLASNDMPKNDAGITVEGSESNQSFVTVSNFETEQSEVLTLKLIGKVNEKPVEKPVTVDIHAVCRTCGKRAKGNDKFCSGCGTSLQII